MRFKQIANLVAMETSYFHGKINPHTAALRAKINATRKYLRNFYTNPWHLAPTSKQVILLLITWVSGIVPLLFYSGLFESRQGFEYRSNWFLAAGSTIFLTLTLISYFLNRKK